MARARALAALTCALAFSGCLRAPGLGAKTGTGDEARFEALVAQCRVGAPAACTEAGVLASEGRVGASKQRRAPRWLRKGCRGGDGRACYVLAERELVEDGRSGRAVAMLRAGCEARFAPACSQMAALYDWGLYVEADPDLGAQYRRQACTVGGATACTALAIEAVRDDDSDRVIDYASRGCDHGDARACALLARAYEQAKPRQGERARTLYTRACKAGVGEACGRAIALSTELALDGVGLRALYRAACDAGDPAGCHYLAGVLADGVGGAPDLQAAAALYNRGCAHRVAASCVQLAFMAAELEGERKFGWLGRACEADARACIVLGEVLERGVWGEPRPSSAADYYQRACAEDNAAACYRLASLLYRGEGVTRDESAAARLHHIACDGGIGDACASLAFMHSRGLGVRADTVVARDYRRRACSLGTEDACRESKTRVDR